MPIVPTTEQFLVAENRRNVLLNDEALRLVQDPASGYCPWTPDNIGEALSNLPFTTAESLSRVALSGIACSSATHEMGEIVAKVIWLYWKSLACQQAEKTVPSIEELARTGGEV